MRSVGVGLVVFAVSLLRSLADGFGMTDESWFLQVVARIRGGEVLYRDVAYGATPLAVNVTSALSHVVGIEILAEKMATCAAFALTLAIFDRLVRRQGLSSTFSWLCVGVLLLVARPYGNPPYTPIATAMFCATLWAIVTATADLASEGVAHGSSGSSYVVAGLCAGLSFASKQNIGLLALGASGAAIVVSVAGVHRSVRPLLLVAAGFAVSVMVALTPLLLQGGWAGFWDYGFAGKGAYLRIGGVNYAASLVGWLSPDVGNLRSLPSAFMGLVRGLVLILPALVALVAVIRRRSLDRTDIVLLLFAAAATVTAFPRWDRFHMGYAVPVHLLTLMALLRRRGPDVGRRPSVEWHSWSIALRAAVALVFIVAVLPPIAAFAGASGQKPSALAHFRGALVSANADQELARSARALWDASSGRPTFILGADAGFWYLESGLSNPTPFDIPTATSVGRTGVEWIEAAIVSGRVRQVCVDNLSPTVKDLVDLRAFVRDHLQRVSDIGPCTLYRAVDADALRTGASP